MEGVEEVLAGVLRGVDDGAGEGATGELESSVRGHVGRDAERADPVVEEGAGDGVGSRGSCRPRPSHPG